LAGSVVFELEKKGIIVRDCEGFGLKNSIRVTIGKKEENEAFLIALKEVLR
jgi:histidinol-phosphate aminotransferase